MIGKARVIETLVVSTSHVESLRASVTNNYVATVAKIQNRFKNVLQSASYSTFVYVTCFVGVCGVEPQLRMIGGWSECP